MGSQRVAPEVTLGVSPDGVDVIGPILNAVVFHQEGRAMQSVVMRGAHVRGAGPGEVDVIQARDLEPRTLRSS